MSSHPSFLVISASLDPASRSRRLAALCQRELSAAGNCGLLDLRELNAPSFDNTTIYASEANRVARASIAAASGIVLAGPTYNWACGSELKKLIEYTGSTPPDGSMHSVWFDKVVTFVNSGGLPQSYMAFLDLAGSLMLDFKCVINPYHVYVDNTGWTNDELNEHVAARLTKSMRALREMTTLLAARTYRSGWEI